MFDLGWSELLVIGIVALIVVGPKDLPGMFKTLGKFTARLRAMARDFSRAMEDAADASGAKDIAKDLRTMTNPKSMGVDALKKATNFDDLDPFGEDDDDEGQKQSSPKVGPHTQKLSEERAEAARKIREHSAKRAQERLDREAAEAAAPAEPAPPPPETAAQPADSPESKA